MQLGRAAAQSASISLPNSALDRVDGRELGEGPAAEVPEVVDARHPIGVHRVGLVLGVLAAKALDLDDEVQRVRACPSSTCTMKSGRYLRGVEPSR